MHKNKPPKKNALLGHFLDKYSNSPTTNGEIESSVGDRSGEAFTGRCYKGDGVGYIDLSSITGVVTAKASWVKNDLDEIHADSLSYQEYKEGVEARIDVVINGSKQFVLDSDYFYHGIAIYEDGVYYDFLNLEEGDGTKCYGKINEYFITNIIADDIHKEDPEVPFSFLNEKGYTTLAGSELNESYGVTYITSGTNVESIVPNPSGKDISLKTASQNGVIVTPYTLNKFGWHDGLFYLTTDNQSGFGSNILNISGVFSSFVLELKCQSIDKNRVRLQARDTTRWADFRDIALSNGYNFNLVYNQGGTNEELIYVISGTDTTFGDNYPDSVGWTGLTSTTVRSWLSTILYDVNQYVSDLLFDLANSPNPSGAGSSILSGNINEYIVDVGTEFIDVVYDSSIKTFDGTLSGVPGKSYFQGNTNEPIKQMSSVQLRRSGAVAEFIIEKFKVSDIPLVPALNKSEDVQGNKLENSGKVRLKAQLKQSYCLEGNGVWSFDFGSAVTSLKVGGVEKIGDCTVVGDIVTPNNGVQLYDLTINDSIHYPCAEGVVLLMQDDNGENELTISNGVVGDVWGFQDKYHWNAIHGIWRSTIDNTLFSPYKIDSNYERFHGSKITRMIPSNVESQLQFPNVPEVLAANINHEQKFSFYDFETSNVPNTFSELKGFRIAEILSYNLMFGSNFPCFNMEIGEQIEFVNTTNWDSFTHLGSGVFTLDISGMKLDCIGSGSIYDLKIYDVNGNLIKWFPFVDAQDSDLAEVVDATQNGTLPNPLNWGTQKNFDYNGVYGSGNSKPSKYIGRLKRSNQTVSGGSIDNIETIKTKGDAVFKSLALTKSFLGKTKKTESTSNWEDPEVWDDLENWID